MTTNSYFEKYETVLEQAMKACETREYFSPFVESPSRKFHPVGAASRGKDEFESYLNRPFHLEQPGEIARTGFEVSPYTQEPLGIDYPKVDVEVVFDASKTAMQSWKKVPFEERAGLCLEMAFELEKQCFANAHATMHTAGQSYLMAFSGSGANALDRGVEAIAYAVKAMRDVRENANWTKSFGRAGEVSLNKTYRLVPRGTAVVICCATFPLWNAYPAIFANLVTGNPAIVKPHPNGILPVAMAVRVCRDVLIKAGHDPNIVIMAADTREEPVTVELLEHTTCKIIDYTGSQRFGTWIEKNCADKLVYTETAGCNGVVVHSTDNIDGLINGLANSLCGFSAQMCTSPQNIHVPASGITIDKGEISFDGFRDLLVEAVENRTETGLSASRLCAAIQADQSIEILNNLRGKVSDVGTVALDSRPYDHPEFPNARTATPMICQVSANESDLYQEEHFAPVSFLIRENSAEAALENAANNAAEFGAISSYAYSSDPDFLKNAKDTFADAGASLWCNMTVPMPINFASAYSDYHVTGLNPAGNACLTSLSFVANRFGIIQFREPANVA